MNKKELFEATNQEPENEQGNALMKHINDILEPFKEIGQIEWAVDTIINTCDGALESFRYYLHCEACRALKEKAIKEKTDWECMCDFNKDSYL